MTQHVLVIHVRHHIFLLFNQQVQISQVTTEAELVKRSNELEGTLAAGSFIEYCNSKIESSTKELERTLWSFLKVLLVVN